jgi:catechol 2,3-dioxygenase-like lactoylglutathione lyase family enzyme
LRIEHFGYSVADPAAVADWYVEHLGFQVRRSADEPAAVRFLADGSGKVMVEIYSNPKVAPPDYASMDPLLLHVALVCEDVPAERQRLIAAGATPVGGVDRLANGDVLAMLRDPWGLAIQLARRGRPMV